MVVKNNFQWSYEMIVQTYIFILLKGLFQVKNTSLALFCENSFWFLS